MTQPAAARAGGFRHTHEALAHRPFTIGLRPFDVEDWIEVDDRLAADLTLKSHILVEEDAAAFAALNGAEAAQAEVLEMLAAHLLQRYPTTYRREGNWIRAGSANLTVKLAGEPPLLTASRLVQEDLLLMQRSDDGWRLVAGSLCFPSTWILIEKLGRPLEAIHAPVPGFSGAMAMRVARIFDHLRAETPLERFNISIYGDARLRHAEPRQAPEERFPPGESILRRAHVRVERQTLRKLARSGAILFTVRLQIDPLAALAIHARRPALARALHEHFEALSPGELAYKGLTEAREPLLAALAALCRGGASGDTEAPT
jgi:hypothetical protein